jgi:hypothetical protein
MSLGACLVEQLFGTAAQAWRQGFEHRAVVDVVVPDLQVPHLGVASNVLAIAAHAGPCSVPRFVIIAAHEADGDGGAGGQPLDVPFPGAGIDLVEIVDAEHQSALGRGIDAEIGNVHVAAGRHRQAGERRA